MPDTPSLAAYDRLSARLSALRKRLTAVEALNGLCASFALAVGCALALLGLESVFYLRPSIKLSLVLACVVGPLALLVSRVVGPLASPPSLQSVALTVEQAFGGLHQRLISAVQLWERPHAADGSPALIAAAVSQADEISAGLDLQSLPDTAGLRRSLVAVGALLLMAVTPFLLWAGSARQAAGRLVHPLTAYSRPADTAIALRPGDADVIAGEPFEIIADLSGIVPLRARLETRESGGSGEWVTRLLSVRRDRVRHRIDAVTRRPAEHPSAKVQNQIVDFEHLDDSATSLRGDLLFSCLGTTRKQADSLAAQRKVDLDYQYKAAQLAANQGVQHYLLVSSSGADIDSKSAYLQMKGELEQQIQVLPFKRISIFQPSLLVGKRAQLRVGEKLADWILSVLCVIPGLRRFHPIQGEEVAAKMVQVSQQSGCSLEWFRLDEIFINK